MTKRRSLTPSDPATPVANAAGQGEEALHAMRRGGARREVSSRVFLHGSTGELHEGWALNVSKGGVRVILEEKVELGREYDVVVGDPDNGGTSARGRIVWIQEEPDGMIVGVEFLGQSGTHKSSPPPPVQGD